MESLGEDILCKILNDIDGTKLRSVCKRWRDAVEKNTEQRFKIFTTEYGPTLLDNFHTKKIQLHITHKFFTWAPEHQQSFLSALKNLENIEVRRLLVFFCRKKRFAHVFLQEIHFFEHSQKRLRPNNFGEILGHLLEVIRGSPNLQRLYFRFNAGHDLTVYSKDFSTITRFLALLAEELKFLQELRVFSVQWNEVHRNPRNQKMHRIHSDC